MIHWWWLLVVAVPLLWGIGLAAVAARDRGALAAFNDPVATRADLHRRGLGTRLIVADQDVLRK